MEEIKLYRTKKIPFGWWGRILIALIILFCAAIIGGLTFFISASGSFGAIGGLIGALVTVPFIIHSTKSKNIDNDNFEELAITEEFINHRIGKYYVTTIRWQDVKLIQYNSKTIAISYGKIVWEYESDIISTFAAIIKKLQLTAVLQEVPYSLISTDKIIIPMIKNGYIDYIFGKKYFIGGVNIFDFYDRHKTKSGKLSELIITDGENVKREKVRLKYFSVKRSLINIKVGIAEFSLNRYAVFVPYKERKKMFLQVNDDIRVNDLIKNSEIKLKEAVRIEKEKLSSEYKIVCGEATNMWCKIIGSNGNFSVQRELFIVNDSYGTISENFYGIIQIGRSDIIADSFNEAALLAEKELKKKYLLSTADFELLQKTKQERPEKDDEYCLHQLRIIFGAIVQFDYREYGVPQNDIVTNELLDEIRKACGVTELAAFLRATLFEYFDNTEINEYLDNNGGMQMLCEVAEYIKEFVLDERRAC